MNGFVDLDRRFNPLTDSELEDAESLAARSDYGSGIGWPKLLKYRRIILLAEAGAGKTAEMRQQAKRLAENGRFAFFVELDSLDREPVEDVLSADKKARLEEWNTGGKAPAWFFLDAVDELKLTRGKLNRALRRLATALHGSLDRARIVISCRPSDWRPHVDANTVNDQLPVPAQGVGVPSAPSEQIFLAALRREYDGVNSETQDQPDSYDVEKQEPDPRLTFVPCRRSSCFP